MKTYFTRGFHNDECHMLIRLITAIEVEKQT